LHKRSTVSRNRRNATRGSSARIFDSSQNAVTSACRYGARSGGSHSAAPIRGFAGRSSAAAMVEVFTDLFRCVRLAYCDDVRMLSGGSRRRAFTLIVGIPTTAKRTRQSFPMTVRHRTEGKVGARRPDNAMISMAFGQARRCAGYPDASNPPRARRCRLRSNKPDSVRWRTDARPPRTHSHAKSRTGRSA